MFEIISENIAFAQRLFLLRQLRLANFFFLTNFLLIASDSKLLLVRKLRFLRDTSSSLSKLLVLCTFLVVNKFLSVVDVNKSSASESFANGA